MLVDFQPVTCPGRQCLVLGVRRASKTSGLNGSRWNEGAACPGSQPALGGISTALRTMREKIVRGEAGSSHTSGTGFPCSGACQPLSVHKCSRVGALWARFCWWPLVWPAASFGDDDGAGSYSFMGVSG